MLKKKCPNCGIQTIYGEQVHFPFCSARCRDGDFLGWVKGEKTLSTEITDADEAMDVLEQRQQDWD
jgi:endogenous inhibitor of DNA gyrase (YacG/DUF329 family)